MAVPRYGAPKQQLNALPQTRVTPSADESAFGGGAAQQNMSNQLQNTLQTAQKAVAQQRYNADQLAVQDADLKAAQLQTDIALSSKNYRGKDAAGYIDYANDSWTKGTDEIRKSLSNDRQRANFDRMAKLRYSDVYKTSQVYMGKELQQYDKDNTEAYVKNEQDQLSALIASGNVPDVYQSAGTSLVIQEESLKAYAARNGEPEEVTKQKIVVAKSATHQTVVNQLMSSGDPMAAKQYYDEFKSEIVGAGAKELGKTVKAQALQYEANSRATEILASTTSQTAALKKINEIKDPALKEATQKRVYLEFSTAEKLAKKNQEAVKAAYNQEVYSTANDFITGKLDLDQLDQKVAAGKLKPEDADAFQLALASPKQWREIEADPKQQAKAGIYFMNAINGMKSGEDTSEIVMRAVNQYVGGTKKSSNGDIDQTDLGWILRAAQMHSNPEQKGIWNRFTSTLPSAMANFGPMGAYQYIREWDFKADPSEYYNQFLKNALAGPVGVDNPPKYIVNAFGFMRQLFDGQVNTDRPETGDKEKNAGSDKPEK